MTATTGGSPAGKIMHHGDLLAGLEAARHAASLPAYRREWGGFVPVTVEDFKRLPFLQKQMLLDGAASEPPFGSRLGVPISDIAYTFVSPGPLYIPATDRDLDNAASATAASLLACGFGPDDIVDQVVAYHWVAGGTLADRGVRKVGCAVIPAGPGNTQLHLDTIRALGATGIVCFPTFLAHLLTTADGQGIKLPLRRAAISGEVHEAGFRERLLGEYGITVRERYGVAEIGTVAWECAETRGLHLRDNVVIETIDPQTEEPIDFTDPRPKELVVTDPERQAMPIIRFRTGDLVEALEVGPCGCGRSSPRLRRIIGRTAGIPRIKGMFVIPKHVGDVLERRGVRTQFQLRIERPSGFDRLAVVLARPHAGLGDIASLKDELAATLRIRAEIDEVEALPADAPQVDDRRVFVEQDEPTGEIAGPR